MYKHVGGDWLFIILFVTSIITILVIIFFVLFLVNIFRFKMMERHPLIYSLFYNLKNSFLFHKSEQSKKNNKTDFDKEAK